jgi:hypothetical protein
VWTRAEASFEGAADGLYGGQFASILRHPPRSAFVAVGSPVEVQVGRRIAADR